MDSRGGRGGGVGRGVEGWERVKLVMRRGIGALIGGAIVLVPVVGMMNVPEWAAASGRGVWILAVCVGIIGVALSFWGGGVGGEGRGLLDGGASTGAGLGVRRGWIMDAGWSGREVLLLTAGYAAVLVLVWGAVV
ncbi:hypothetical protein ACMFMG_011130 [Clarireedia jacksonii]